MPSPYWVGLLTLPAIVGVLAGLYGLYRGAGWLIDKSVVRLVPPAGNAWMAAGFAGTIAATRRAFMIVRITNLISVFVTVGAVDGEKADRVRRVVAEELTPARTIGLKRSAPKEGESR